MAEKLPWKVVFERSTSTLLLQGYTSALLELADIYDEGAYRRLKSNLISCLQMVGGLTPALERLLEKYNVDVHSNYTILFVGDQINGHKGQNILTFTEKSQQKYICVADPAFFLFPDRFQNFSQMPIMIGSKSFIEETSKIIYKVNKATLYDPKKG